MLRKTRTFLKESPYFKTYTYRKSNELGIIEETEYPINAVEEAIVNALIHRDYHSNFPIECRAFRDTFVVQSGGGLI
jgi:predicted HTH transcriptional regulator